RLEKTERLIDRGKGLLRDRPESLDLLVPAARGPCAAPEPGETVGSRRDDVGLFAFAGLEFLDDIHGLYLCERVLHQGHDFPTGRSPIRRNLPAGQLLEGVIDTGPE